MLISFDIIRQLNLILFIKVFSKGENKMRFKKAIFIIVIILGLFTIIGSATFAQWGWKLATDPSDVISFLNGTGAYDNPVSETRISMIWKGNHAEFYLFYRQQPTSGSAGGWGWKLAANPDDVHHFLNGTGGYTQPVKDAQIAAMWKGDHPEFYIFYQRPTAGERAIASWGWKLAPDPSDAMNFLNGTGGYRHPVTTARIAALEKDDHDEFYIFYQKAAVGSPISNWKWKLATTMDDAFNFVNGLGAYSQAVKGFDLTALWKGSHARFYIFPNQDTKIWLQSPLENERFVQGESVHLRALVTSEYPIDDSSLSWSSSLDGAIGQEPSFTIDNLSVGTHTIKVIGCDAGAESPVRIFADLGEFYQAAPAQAEIARIDEDLSFQWINGAAAEEQWSSYPMVFDQQSTDPSKLVIYAKIDVLRHQHFSEPLPFTGGKMIYEHFTTHVNILNMRLDCNVNTGGGGQVSLNRNLSVWDGRVSGTASDSNACKNPFPNPTLYPYVNPLYLLIHEGRHSEPDDSGHTSCDGSSNMDHNLQGGSGHAWAAMYSMWVYKYGKYDPPMVKNEAKAIAKGLLESRFCSTPTHSNPKVQAIIDELLQP